MEKRNYLLTKALTAILAVAPVLSLLEDLAANTKPTQKQVQKNKYWTQDFEKDSEEVLLARMIWGEARGCSEKERIAVGYTAVNRANDGKKWNGETIKEAILKPFQYSCFNNKDPNLEQMKNPETYDIKSFHDCLQISKGILSGKYQDTVKATHYFNPNIVKPRWADKLKKIGRISVGKNKLSEHEFYIEK